MIGTHFDAGWTCGSCLPMLKTQVELTSLDYCFMVYKQIFSTPPEAGACISPGGRCICPYWSQVTILPLKSDVYTYLTLKKAGANCLLKSSALDNPPKVM